MEKLKKYAAPLAVFALIVVAAGTFTFMHVSSAQTTTAPSTTTTNSSGKTWARGGGIGMGHGVMGTVASISGSTISLTGKNNTPYSVNDSGATVSKFTNGTKTTIPTSDIATGDTLMVMGTVSGSNVTAKNIIDGALPTPPAPAATGTVASISGNTLTVTDNGTTYTVDASNAAFSVNKSAGTSLANSGIIVGDTVTVFGTVSGSNIAATRIMDGKGMMGFGMRPMMHNKPAGGSTSN
jgi:hypothetical protein